MLAALVFAVPVVLLGEDPARDAPPPTPAALEKLVERLGSADKNARLEATRAIAQLPASGQGLYAERLLRPRTIEPATYRQLVLEIWAQVPNPEYPAKGGLWMQKPEPAWKPPPRGSLPKGAPRPRRPPPHDPEQVEWLTALNELDLEAEALIALPDRVQARAEALEAVALMRRLAATGQAEAAEAIFEFAFRLEGVFRDECGRALRSMGTVAIPTLIRRMHARGKGLGKQNRWALWQLDRMDRSRPGKTISTAPDDRSRAEIIRAYGEVRALDAVEAILGQLDATSRQVRRAARWAWMRYVTGPPPPPSPSRKRKLPGGKEEGEAKEDYLNYREMALLALERELTALEEEQDYEPSAEVSSKSGKHTNRAELLTHELLTYYDNRRAAIWSEQLAVARTKREAGDLEGAAEQYRQILIHDPYHEQRGEMSEVFLALGERRLQAGDRRGARSAFEQGLALATDPAKVRQGEALLEYLKGLDQGTPGQDAELFRRALALDPSLSPARARLQVIEDQRRQKRRRGTLTVVALASGGTAGLALLVALLLRRRRVAPLP